MLSPPAEPPRTQIIERTRHRFQDIHSLLDKRWTISAIARRLNLDRKAVRHPGARLPGQPPGRPQTSRRPPRGYRRSDPTSRALARSPRGSCGPGDERVNDWKLPSSKTKRERLAPLFG
ncbi:hypothetical protein [Streptomyces sp. NPDC006739]|uniref:hypothetical protein n=1 Tax=Streptomyces sp. NPDC006739 TaxID=3364763 RepID=UPI0036A5DF2A